MRGPLAHSGRRVLREGPPSLVATTRPQGALCPSQRPEGQHPPTCPILSPGCPWEVAVPNIPTLPACAVVPSWFCSLLRTVLSKLRGRQSLMQLKL